MTNKPAHEQPKTLRDDYVFSVSPQDSRRIKRELFRPFLGRFVLLGLIAVGLSFLASVTQVALTPLLEIVLHGSDAVATSLGSGTQAFTFDLNEMGLSILRLAALATGFTDPWPLLLVTSGAYLILAVIGQVASFITRFLADRMRTRVVISFSHKIYSHILHLPLSFLDKHPSGWLQARLVGDARRATDMLNELIIDGLSNSLLSVFYAILLLQTDSRLTIIAAVAGAVHIGVSRWLANSLAVRLRGELGSNAGMQAMLQERLMAVRDVKVLGGEEVEKTTFLGAITDYAAAVMRNHFIKRVEPPVRTAINQVVIVAVMLFGAWELIHGRLTTSAFLLFMFFAQSLIGPLAKLTGILLQTKSINTSLEGVCYILSHDPETSGDRPLPPEGFREALVVRNLSFSYENLPVLSHINLTIKKGEMVALVGRSGAGKTTLVDLLLRLYDPVEGSIELDGVPVQDFDLAQYRRLFGVVAQDATLFNETVYKNIAYARPELTREEVMQAAHVANADGFISSELPHGYDTVLGERGVLISGGQRQRIAVARAVAHRPQILVLDEATSSLDTESERLVQDAIARVVKDSTAIVIAHRLSTVRMADKIVVLKGGRIVEVGTHEELLAHSGEYRYLHDLQFYNGEAADAAKADQSIRLIEESE